MKRKDTERYEFKNAKYVGIYDGDTFYVDIPSLHPIFGKKIGVRVRGIDTPELRGGTLKTKAAAKAAKEFARNLLENGKRLRLTNCSRGTFSRIVCDVSNSNTKNLGQDLIKAGHAVKYER